MAKRLAFNLEELESFSRTIQDLSTDLQELEQLISSEMIALKTGWDTPAGRAFFEKQDLEWAEEVKHYIQILDTLKEMIDYAHSQYSEVKNTAEKLSVVL